MIILDVSSKISSLKSLVIKMSEPGYRNAVESGTYGIVSHTSAIVFCSTMSGCNWQAVLQQTLKIRS
jgi:hypothetical protein